MHRIGVLTAQPEGAAARRQHGQAGDGGEQPGDLARVVEEALEAVEHEQGRRVAMVEPLGELVGRRGDDAERGGRFGGQQAGIVDAVEVDMNGTAPVVLGHAAGGLQRQPGLAHAARADEREQAHARAGEDPRDLRQLAVTADQFVGRRRQRRRRGTGRGDSGQLGVVLEDRLLEPPQLTAGLDPQLLDQQPAPLAHHLERLRLPAAAIQRQHQVRPQPLSQGMLGHQRPQLADQVSVAPAGELGAHPLLDRLDAQLLEAVDLALCELVEAMVGQRGPTPEPESRFKVGSRRRRVLGARSREQVLEAMRVDGVGLHRERIAGGAAVDRGGVTEPVAQAGHLLLQGLHTVARRVARPHGIDQLVDRDRLWRAQRQRREQGALLRAVELDSVPLDAHVERAEQPDVDDWAHPVCKR